MEQWCIDMNLLHNIQCIIICIEHLVRIYDNNQRATLATQQFTEQVKTKKKLHIQMHAAVSNVFSYQQQSKSTNNMKWMKTHTEKFHNVKK